MKKFGLLGFPLSHSFSKKYFSQKFIDLDLDKTHVYDQYELENLDNLKEIINKNEDLAGMNVTIPHKVNIIPYLSEIDPAAEKIGAVNVVKVLPNNKLKGYNSDYYGFKTSLEGFLNGVDNIKAFVIGNGGAAKAIMVALQDLSIEYEVISRQISEGSTLYENSAKFIKTHKLIINCTPLGTFPNIETCPPLDYSEIDSSYFFYDLVYNPELTRFLEIAKNCNAKYKNGYEMLVLQAEKSWEIWNS